MRLLIDLELCIGAGLCVAASPERFALVETEWGPRAELQTPVASEGLDADSEASLLAAARACPTLAIRISDDEGHRVYPPEGLRG
jgi:ferredoxin